MLLLDDDDELPEVPEADAAELTVRISSGLLEVRGNPRRPRAAGQLRTLTGSP